MASIDTADAVVLLRCKQALKSFSTCFCYRVKMGLSNPPKGQGTKYTALVMHPPDLGGYRQGLLEVSLRFNCLFD
jgi:hypothetical protein